MPFEVLLLAIAIVAAVLFAASASVGLLIGRYGAQVHAEPKPMPEAESAPARAVRTSRREARLG
jgi:hypothetical protein